MIAITIILLAVTLVLAIFAFEIWMIVDAAKNKALDDTTKAIWIVGMLLLHPFVAVAYYFIARSKQ